MIGRKIPAIDGEVSGDRGVARQGGRPGNSKVTPDIDVLLHPDPALDHQSPGVFIGGLGRGRNGLGAGDREVVDRGRPVKMEVSPALGGGAQIVGVVGVGQNVGIDVGIENHVVGVGIAKGQRASVGRQGSLDNGVPSHRKIPTHRNIPSKCGDASNRKS